MSNQEKVIWDTTDHPAEYPKKIKEIYFKASLLNRKPFTNWIGDISKNFQNDIDWWVTLPLSRDSTGSNLFHYICILKTLEVASKKIKKILIKVNSKLLSKLIRLWSIKNNISVNLEYVHESKKINEYFIIIKTTIFNFFLFFFIKNFTKKINIKNNNKKTVLIDTFATKDSIKCERLYRGLDTFLLKKKLSYVYFVPTFIIERNIFNITKIIFSLNSRNYLFKEHYLNLQDIIFSCFHFLRIKKYIKKFKPYHNWDLSDLICEEITSSKNYPSKVGGILNYRFAKNLHDNEIQIKKTINWFENQIVDKGWNLGFRRYFKKIKTYGYQGFLHSHFMHSIPTKYEEQAEVIPSELITIGKAYRKLKKEFFSQLKVSIGPALNYLDVFKASSKKKTIKLLVVLSGIKSPDTKLMQWVNSIQDIEKKLKIIVKPHPILPLNKIDIKENLSKNIILSHKKLPNLLQKASLVVCSGPTSATIESLAYGCFLLVPVIEANDALSLKALNISKRKYCLIYNKIQLGERIKKELKNKIFFKKKKRNNVNFKKLLFENINNKNLRYYY